jgi:hypothetical protein
VCRPPALERLTRKQPRTAPRSPRNHARRREPSRRAVKGGVCGCSEGLRAGRPARHTAGSKCVIITKDYTIYTHISTAHTPRTLRRHARRAYLLSHISSSPRAGRWTCGRQGSSAACQCVQGRGERQRLRAAASCHAGAVPRQPTHSKSEPNTHVQHAHPCAARKRSKESHENSLAPPHAHLATMPPSRRQPSRHALRGGVWAAVRV